MFAAALVDNAKELLVATLALIAVSTIRWWFESRKADKLLHEVTPSDGSSAYDVLSKRIDDGNDAVMTELRALRTELVQEREERHSIDNDHAKRINRLEGG